MNAKHVMLGFLAGAAVAGIGTLLCAPASGKDLCKNISNNKENFQNVYLDIKLKIKEMKHETVSASLVSKEAVTLFISDVKALIHSWKEDIEPHKNEIQIRIKEIESALGELEQVVSLPTANKE
ncbi:YtxH domain-containing protein [Bacillus sp. JJ722]|uniref:YtxH domain-containing protein n=1 Tax=Bacillus sp. JJ722 TaxID=3122973 RepID=UPI002FFD6E9C